MIIVSDSLCWRGHYYEDLVGVLSTRLQQLGSPLPRAETRPSWFRSASSTRNCWTSPSSRKRRKRRQQATLTLLLWTPTKNSWSAGKSWFYCASWSISLSYQLLWLSRRSIGRRIPNSCSKSSTSHQSSFSSSTSSSGFGQPTTKAVSSFRIQTRLPVTTSNSISSSTSSHYSASLLERSRKSPEMTPSLKTQLKSTSSIPPCSSISW